MRTFIAPLFVFAVWILTAAAADEYDVIVRHGTIVDGTGLPRYKADVAILNERVAKIGNLSADRALIDIDAAGLFVAPGFINIHSHAQADALPTAENMLTQGVTTEIVNPDGGGAIDLAEQLFALRSAGLAENVGAYIGFNSAWSSVMGPADRRPTADDIAKMRQLILDGLENGAWGVSAGLDYKPAYYAQVEEVIKVVDVAAAWRTNFTNHDRLTPESSYSSRVGVAETIAIGEKTGLVPVVTHMKSQGREQGAAGALLDLMQEATSRGNYTAADAYPYLAGQSGLGALIIPAWAQDGGRDAMLARFQDPAQRARIVREAEEAMQARFGGPEGVYLPAAKRELTDVMREINVSGGEAIVRLLEQANMGAILRFGSEADLVKILRHPTTSIACDCGATTETRTHPRNYGTFPRVLGHYVRETKQLTWEDAVRKMTGLPANTIGMIDRGFLAHGMIADVTIFDPDTVVDRATYEDPAQRSEGIRYVLVNGELALRDGKVTGVRAGRILTRHAGMPSRAMSTTIARRVAARGTLSELRDAGAGTAASNEAAHLADVVVDVAEDAAANRAKGTFRFTDRESTFTFESVAFGVLQTAGNWASFTARIKRKQGGEEGSALVVVDGTDPAAPNQPPTVTVEIEGRYRFRGAAPRGSVQVASGPRR